MRRWSEGALIAAAVAAGYWNSLSNGFVFDDRLVIVDNPKIARSQWSAIWTSPSWFPERDDRGWRPLTSTFLAADQALHGADPAPWRALNLVLHAANSVLVVRLAALAGLCGSAPLWAGLLFALHPIHTEALGPVVGRADLLAALFTLLACLAYAARRLPWALACFVLGLLAKESAVVWVLLAPLLVGRQEEGRPWPWKRLLRDAALCGAVLGGYLLLRSALIGEWLPRAGTVSPLDNPLGNAPAAVRVSNAVYVLWRYVALLVVPHPLSADYSFDAMPALAAFSARNLLAALLLAACAWGLALWSRRQAGAAFAAGFFALTFLPVSNILFPVGSVMAERFVYLPSVGFCLLLAAALSRLERRATAAALAVILAAYAGLCLRRNRDWKDDAAVFTRIRETSPRSVRGMVNAGQVMLERGLFEQARDLNLAAIALEPLPASPLRDAPTRRYALPHGNLGIAYMSLGDLVRAEAALQEALRLEPENLDAWVNIGIVFAKQTRFDGALDAFTTAESLIVDPAAEPHACKLYYNLALTLRRKAEFLAAQGSPAQAAPLLRRARAKYEQALAVNPGYEEARRGLESLRAP